jgi:EmrB/QacA subfamily drug resistance transporter
MDRKWWTLTTVCVGVFMLLLDVTIVNVALPDIERALHASLSDLQWTLDAYALTLAALLLTAGSLADQYGRRRLFAIGTVVFTLGSLLCGLSGSATFLIAARAGQGVGGAIMFATALALLADAFRGKERGVAFGAFGAVSGVAVAVGPVLGGVLTSGISWRWIFFVNVPVGAVALAITLTRVAESKEPRATRPDWPGFVVFSVALGLLVYGLIRSNTVGWSSGVVIGCLIAAGVLLGVFVVVELRVAQPMFDLGLLRKPTFAGGLIAAFALSAGLFAMFTYLVLYLQNVLGLSAVQTGVRFLVLSGALFVAASLAGRLSQVVPIKLLISPGFVLVGAGLLLMRGLTVTSTWTHLIPGMIVSGVGAGMVSVPLASTAVGVVAPEHAGMASGVNSTFRQVGIATGIAALGSVFSAHIRHVVTDALTSATPAVPADVAENAGHLVASGAVPRAVAAVPPGSRATLAAAARAGFVGSINDILLIGAIVAFVAAALCFGLVRAQDFVDSTVGETVPTEQAPAPTA